MAKKKQSVKKHPTNKHPEKKPVGKKYAAILIFIIIVTAIISITILSKTPRTGNQVVSNLVADSSFNLINQDGKKTSDKDFKDKKKIVFFGFTHCPDICPVSLQNISLALDSLDKKAASFQPIFITVDPERDTPEVLKEYLKSFNKSFVALTGDKTEIERVEKNFRAFSEKVPAEDNKQEYTMNHSTLIYVLDKKGRYLTHFNYSNSPDDMAATLKDLD